MYMEIILPAILICLITFLLTALIVSRFGNTYKKSVSEVNSLVREMEKMPPCDINNMETIQKTFTQIQDPVIKDAWTRFSQDANQILGGKIVPETSGYFNYEEIYSVPRSEKRLSALWLVLFVLSGVVFCLPPATAALLGKGQEDLFFALGVGFAGSALMGLILIAFFASFSRTKARTEVELHKFRKGIERVLPVASAASQTGLLLEGTRQNTIAFGKMAKDIGESLENFATQGITPRVVEAFENSIQEHIAPSIQEMQKTLQDLSDKVVETQLENMQNLADSFSQKLATSVDQKISTLCDNVDRVNLSMQEIQDSMKLSANTLYTSLEADRKLLTEASEQVKETAGIQQSASENISVLSKHLEATGQLVETLVSWNGMIKESATSISESMREAVESNVETAQGLAKTMESLANAGSEQYEKAASAAAKLLNDVVIEMNKAMDGVGHEIAESITKASSDSVDIIDRLSEKTSQLKEEYDKYFERVENQSRTGLDDMDFHMQSVIGRFSEEAITIMDKLESNITKAMGMFEGNTTELLSSLEEQSRSIGLYAHDLNIDISDLSINLKESVKVFNEQLHAGVERTFQDFDGGLSEVSERLANTIESIRESVENLPKALKHEK